MELRQAADQVTAKNAELLRLNRDNGRLLEQATYQQQALTAAEREHRKTCEELEALRVPPAQVASLERRTANGERRTAQAMVDAVGLKSRQDYAQSQLEQARR